jgi:hypothetical protein
MMVVEFVGVDVCAWCVVVDLAIWGVEFWYMVFGCGAGDVGVWIVAIVSGVGIGGVGGVVLVGGSMCGGWAGVGGGVVKIWVWCRQLLLKSPILPVLTFFPAKSYFH